MWGVPAIWMCLESSLRVPRWGSRRRARRVRRVPRRCRRQPPIPGTKGATPSSPRGRMNCAKRSRGQGCLSLQLEAVSVGIASAALAPMRWAERRATASNRAPACAARKDVRGALIAGGRARPLFTEGGRSTLIPFERLQTTTTTRPSMEERGRSPTRCPVRAWAIGCTESLP